MEGPRVDGLIRLPVPLPELWQALVLQDAECRIRHRVLEDEEIDRMAEMEHGRYNVERLLQGWRYGDSRDDELRLHPLIVPWGELPEGEKHNDRNVVRRFSETLAAAGIELYRPGSEEEDET